MPVTNNSSFQNYNYPHDDVSDVSDDDSDDDDDEVCSNVLYNGYRVRCLATCVTSHWASDL